MNDNGHLEEKMLSQCDIQIIRAEDLDEDGHLINKRSQDLELEQLKTVTLAGGELRFNPNRDPKTGRFTFGDGSSDSLGGGSNEAGKANLAKMFKQSGWIEAGKDSDGSIIMKATGSDSDRKIEKITNYYKTDTSGITEQLKNGIHNSAEQYLTADGELNEERNKVH